MALVDSKLPPPKISVKEELHKRMTAAAKKRHQNDESHKTTKDSVPIAVVKPNSKPKRRISNEFDRTEDTLYMSAIDL